jgi:hypothetical protein
MGISGDLDRDVRLTQALSIAKANLLVSALDLHADAVGTCVAGDGMLSEFPP